MTDFTAAFELFLDDSFTDKESLQLLLTRLNAPSNLLGIAGVFENIKEALQLPLMKEVNCVDSLVEDIRLMEEIVYQCHPKITTEKRHALMRRNQKDLKIGAALRGTIDDHPIYALYYLNSDENQRFFHWLRQVMFTLERTTTHRLGDGQHFKKHDFNGISIAMRRLTENNEVASKWLLQQNCSYIPSYAAFIEILFEYLDFFRANSEMFPRGSKKQGKLEHPDPRERNQYLYKEMLNVISILKIALYYKKPRRNGAPRSNGSKVITSSLNHHGISALTGSSLVYPETLPTDNHSEETLYSVLQTNFGEDEILSGEELFEQSSEEMYIFAEQEPIEHYIAAFHGRRLASASRKRVERQHQFLPTSNHLLSKQQLQQLLKACFQSRPDDSELAKRILMILFCARAANDFKFTKQIQKFGQGSIAIPLVLFDCSEVALPAFQINYENDFVELNATPLANIITLPFPNELREWLFVNKSENARVNSDKLFDDDHFDLSELEDFIGCAGLNDISITQISNHLFLRACQKFGSATATLMFGKPAPGSQARLYYTALPQTEIRARYRELIMELSEHSAVPLNFTDLDKFPDVSDLSLGCRYKPQTSQYQEALSQLRADLKNRRAQVLNDAQWLIFHNEFTVYSILCQGLLTGLRPTHDGFIRWNDILHSAGVAVVRDKDTSDEFHSRTVPLHPLAIKIAENYHEHLKSVLGRLHRLGMLEQWRTLECPEPFFFTNANPKRRNADPAIRVAITPFRPGKYFELLKPWLEFPANSHRKFLRSFLDLRRVSPEIVDAFLGHGNLGEHFWHPQSTLSFTDIRQTLTPHLDALIELLDIRAVSGLSS